MKNFFLNQIIASSAFQFFHAEPGVGDETAHVTGTVHVAGTVNVEADKDPITVDEDIVVDQDVKGVVTPTKEQGIVSPNVL